MWLSTGGKAMITILGILLLIIGLVVLISVVLYVEDRNAKNKDNNP
jgi:hypothetical protein